MVQQDRAQLAEEGHLLVDRAGGATPELVQLLSRLRVGVARADVKEIHDLVGEIRVRLVQERDQRWVTLRLHVPYRAPEQVPAHPPTED